MTTRRTASAQSDRPYPVVDPYSLPDVMEPLPDAMFQESAFFESRAIVKAHFKDRSDVFISGNTIVCYNPDNLNDRVMPDCYLALGVDPDAILQQNGYLTWQVGKAPDFVLEIGSASTAHRDMGFKRDLYARIGVAEYWRFDPSGGDFYGQPLIGERLVDGTCEPFEMSVNSDGIVSSYSPILGLNMCVGENRLLFQEPSSGVYLRSLEEELDRDREAQESLQEERQGRQTAENRVRELEEELRRLQS